MRNPTAPLVTIAIPTLGRIDLLLQAIVSARAQTHASVEVLVGDNSAEESLSKAIASVVPTSESVRVLVQPERLPMADHWNALADAALGDWFVILADDDFLEPDFVRKLVKMSESVGEVGVVFSDHRIMDAKGRIDAISSEFYTRENGRADLAAGLISEAALPAWRGSIPICASIMRTALVRRYRFNGELNTPEIEFFARLAAGGERFAYLPERLARYRIHAESETQRLGLRNDLLFRALRAVPAPPAAEALRRKYLEDLVVTAVTRAFCVGDMQTVRDFVHDEFYPERGRPVAALQRLAARFPNFAAPPVFRFLYGLLRPFRPKRPLSQ